MKKFVERSLESFYPHFREQVVSSLPEGFILPSQCRPYLEREQKSQTFELLGTDSCVGARWRHGPFVFEKYFSDDEPIIFHKEPWRLVIWKPLFFGGKPKGWHAGLFFVAKRRLTGFTDITEEYEKQWSSHARRHARTWRNQHELQLGECSLQAFLDGYQSARQDFFMKQASRGILRRKQRAHGELLRLWGAWRADDPLRKIIAGLACVDIPELKQSVHVSAFFCSSATRSSANVGLIDRWFLHCKEQGICYANFDTFWAPGDDRSWRGFSRFKAQFGVRFIHYPRPLIRLAGFSFFSHIH